MTTVNFRKKKHRQQTPNITFFKKRESIYTEVSERGSSYTRFLIKYCIRTFVPRGTYLHRVRDHKK